MWMWCKDDTTCGDKVKIKFIKLSQTEEIIAECTDKSNGIFIKDAAVIVSLELGKINLVTWLPYTKVQEGFFLPEKAYLFTADVQDDMAEYYNKWRTEPFSANKN